MTGARWFLAIVVAVVGLTSTAAAQDADPLGLTLDGGISESYGIGTDTVAVWVCEIEDDDEFSAQDVADWANTDIAPFFTLISRGRYTVVFEAAGEFTRVNDCLSEGTALTSDPRFTNVFVIDDTDSGGGFGGPGGFSVGPNGIAVAGLTAPPSQTSRGFFVGGGMFDFVEGGTSFNFPATPTHEIGHTLAWPHSGTSTTGLGQYDNPSDLMSKHGVDNLCEVEGSPGLFRGPCFITHTIAFNRYASGWVDADEIALGTKPVTLDLAGPEASGTQFALLPSADELVFTTVEARPAGGYDAETGVEGVMLHTVDQREPCSSFLCWGLDRRQKPALENADVTAHVVGVGESATVHGLTVTVDAATADGYTVTITGTAQGCAMGPNPFVDLSSSSFAYADIGCIRILGITTGTSANTYTPTGTVTREQMAAFLARLWRALGNSCDSSPTPFTDIAGSFAAADIACIFHLGVTTGTGPTTYAPAGTVTREQMAAFLARLWRALGNDCDSSPTPFTDIGGSFADVDIACIFHLGITTGTSPTTYEPASTVTREQMAAFLARSWRFA